MFRNFIQQTARIMKSKLYLSGSVSEEQLLKQLETNHNLYREMSDKNRILHDKLDKLLKQVEQKDKKIVELSDKIDQLTVKEWYNRAWFVLSVSGLGIYGTLISDEHKENMKALKKSTKEFFDELGQNTTEEEIAEFFLELD